MDIKQLGLIFAGLCAAIFFLARGDAERDEAAPGLLTAFMEASDRVASRTAGFDNGSAGPGAALMSDGTLVPVKSAFTKYRAARKADMPSDVQDLEPFAGCKPAPAPGSAVYAFASGEALAQAALYPVDRDDLDRDIESLISSHMLGNARPAHSGNARYLGMSVFDVAVTDTAQPVTLVLQTQGRSVIWNVHRAPGAEVAQVVLLGGKHAGVTGLDPSTTIAVMDRSALAACGLNMSFPPPKNHVIYSSVELGLREAEASLSAWQVRDTEWAAWLETQFGTGPGRPSDDKSITAFVAGPVSEGGEGPAEFTPLNGQVVHMLPADHLFAGKNWKDQYRAAVTQHAEQLAGQPLENLLPETIEGVAQ